MGLLSEDDVKRIVPTLAHRPAALRQFMAALDRAGDENERPSDAVNSRGMIEGSDVEDLEGYRRENMGNGFQLPEGAFTRIRRSGTWIRRAPTQVS